jgi:hypothetical protein
MGGILRIVMEIMTIKMGNIIHNWDKSGICSAVGGGGEEEVCFVICNTNLFVDMMYLRKHGISS